MKHAWLAGALGLCAILTQSSAGRADTVPDFFVDGDACRKLSRECTCADAPMIQLLLRDKRKALDAWDAVADSIDEPGGPSTNEDARNAFVGSFQGDPRIGDQFLACPSYDEVSAKQGRSPSRIAGVSLTGGGGALDPCYCQQFCLDAVNATIAHEDDHFRFGFEAILEVMTAKSACLIGALDQTYCDKLGARQQARTEQYAHVISIDHLSDSVSKLAQSQDDEHPDMACTWEPLPDLPPSDEPDPKEHASLWQRLELLVSRFVHGQAQLG